ncbi:MAG: hypothetical protein JW828_06275 [Sedimentisphaerales bacterium]|nr:hypothetical protein [Sedimentisphaerales bacterium]
MARIVYGVAGEGFGHSSRSHLIGQHLIEQGHDLLFVASGKALSYLSDPFPDRVRPIAGLQFSYDKGRIRCLRTILNNMMCYPRAWKSNAELFENHLKPFEPDLVISDFEPFSAWWAWRNDVPYISVDHEHLLTHCVLEHHPSDWFARTAAYVVTRSYYFRARKYLVLNFFDAPVRSPQTMITPPVIRPAVAAFQPERKEHILVYSTDTTTRESLLHTLGQFKKDRFYVYGFNEDKEIGNCRLKTTSTESFLADLSACRGVVATAGFSLISECLYFHKKMLLIPVLGQYEQIINARYIDRLGLGVASEILEEQAMRRFLEIVDAPMPNNPHILWPDNHRFMELFDDTIATVLSTGKS